MDFIPVKSVPVRDIAGRVNTRPVRDREKDFRVKTRILSAVRIRVSRVAVVDDITSGFLLRGDIYEIFVIIVILVVKVLIIKIFVVLEVFIVFKIISDLL